MSTRNLDKIFNPKSIALVGASEDVGKLGYILFRNLIDGGFKGPVYPVHPRAKTILGKKAYKSVTELKGEVDLAIIVTRIDAAPEVIRDCASRKILGLLSFQPEERRPVNGEKNSKGKY